MNRRQFATLLIVPGCSGTAARAFAADSFKSGLQPGERPTPFQVIDVTGPNRGRALCYV